MGETSGKMSVEKLILFSDDLVNVLKEKRDLTDLVQCLQNSNALRSSCDSDLHQVQNLFRDYEKKIDACVQKTEAAKSEVIADEDLNRLQSELDGEVRKESLVMEEIRVVTNDFNDLESQRIAVQEKKRISKKLEKDEFRKQRTLSMYASVTNIIPNLEDQSSVSGYIVNRDKEMVQKFEFDPTKTTAFETCESIWKMIIS